jgi:uncharacterized integral membrane protein
MSQAIEATLYQGQFGEFTITAHDRREVILYRAGLAVAALCFAIATGLILWHGADPTVITLLSVLYSMFCLALGLSLFTVHIYMAFLHRALQAFWAIGVVASLIIAYADPTPLALTVYHHPFTLLGVGFSFAALTGIFFKEAFCFNRLETKLLTPIIPALLLGHLIGWLPIPVEQGLLSAWSVLFLIFAFRKVIQPIPPDIGDKSVFTYLRQQRLATRSLG